MVVHFWVQRSFLVGIVALSRVSKAGPGAGTCMVCWKRVCTCLASAPFRAVPAVALLL